MDLVPVEALTCWYFVVYVRNLNVLPLCLCFYISCVIDFLVLWLLFYFVWLLGLICTNDVFDNFFIKAIILTLLLNLCRFERDNLHKNCCVFYYYCSTIVQLLLMLFYTISQFISIDLILFMSDKHSKPMPMPETAEEWLAVAGLVLIKVIQLKLCDKPLEERFIDETDSYYNSENELEWKARVIDYCNDAFAAPLDNDLAINRANRACDAVYREYEFFKHYKADVAEFSQCLTKCKEYQRVSSKNSFLQDAIEETFFNLWFILAFAVLLLCCIVVFWFIILFFFSSSRFYSPLTLSNFFLAVKSLKFFLNNKLSQLTALIYFIQLKIKRFRKD